ncbi:hypothetical protein SprV_0100262600 [Sparganum proliferum]
MQAFLHGPPTDASYTRPKAELIRLTSASDSRRYRILVKEEAFGDRKQSEFLRRIRSLVGNMATEDSRFQQFGVTLHPAKCVLEATSLELFGHQIDSNAIQPLPSKVAAIRDFSPPTSKRQLQRFFRFDEILSPVSPELCRHHPPTEQSPRRF